MSKNTSQRNVFLQIGFRSSEREGTLKTIELLGVPGERTGSGKYVVNDRMRRFFDDLIVRKLFRDSRYLPSCDFEYLKIWLHDTDSMKEDLDYDIPKIDKRDLTLRPSSSTSQLDHICVLDNELKGSEYEKWRSTCESLFTPLFGNFMTPPEPPSVLKNIPLVRMAGSIAEKVDPYLKMKQNTFFNALIVQID